MMATDLLQFLDIMRWTVMLDMELRNGLSVYKFVKSLVIVCSPTPC
jgi:hypothetical protein